MTELQAKRAADSATTSRRANPIRTLWRAARTLLILLLILYIVGLVASRTDGFRSIIAQRLEKIVGMPVKVDRASLAMNYALTLRGVATEGEPRVGVAGVRARQVDVEWRWSNLWRHGRLGIARLKIDRPEIAFAEREDGTWSPSRLAQGGEFILRQLNVSLPGKKAVSVSDATEAEKLPVSSPDKSALAAVGIGLDANVSFKRGEVVWWARGSDAPLASIEGASLSVTPVHLPGREITHYLLTVDRAASAGGPGVSGLVAELLDMGDQQIVLRFLAEHTPNLPSDRAEP